MMSLKKLLTILGMAMGLLSAQAEYVNDWTVGETTWHLAAPADWEGGIFDPMSESWTKPPYPPEAILTGVTTSKEIARNLIIPTVVGWPLHGEWIYDPHGTPPLTAIRATAFRNWNALESVTIPGTIKSIYLPCFRGCGGLTNITYVGGFGSGPYNSQDGVLYDRDMKKLFKYPEGRVGSFYTVPSSVTSLATGCLAGTKLKGVLFEGDCPEATSAAFSDSTCAIYRYSDAAGWPAGVNVRWCGRPVIPLPRSMVETVASTNQFGVVTKHEYHYEICDGVLYKYEKKSRWKDEPPYSEYYGVTLCSASYVYGDVKLPSLLGGLPVVALCEKFIGSAHFDARYAVTSVEIPVGVKSIGNSAFDSCSDLKSVVLPEGLESIGTRAFAYCHSLKDVHLPDSLRSVGANAFAYSENLLDRKTMPGLVMVDGWVVEPGEDFIGDTLDLHGTRGIVDGAFEGCGVLKRVIMSPEIHRIGAYTFYGCTNLEDVAFCKGLAHIGGENYGDDTYAFAYCAMRKVALPDGCGAVLSSVFRGTPVEHLCVPPSSGIVGPAGTSAVSDLWQLKTIDYAGVEVGDYTFMGCSCLENVILRDGVKRVGLAAFGDCVSLKTLVVPPSVAEFDAGFAPKGSGQHLTMYIPTTLKSYIANHHDVYTWCPSYTTIFYDPSDFHYVSFDAAGGTMDAPDFITVGGKLWQYPEPRLAKHSFLGWFTERDGGTKVSPSSKITADMTLYAHWLYDGSAMVNVECDWAFSGGNKLCKAGEKVNLKVMAPVVHVTHTDLDGVVTKWDDVFAGWYLGNAPLVSEQDYRSSSLVYVAKGEADVTIEGRYVRVADDAANLSIANIAEGEVFTVNGEWQKKIEVNSYSLPSVSVKGLPAGLKFDAKTLTISGKPTKPGTYAVELSLKNVSVKTAKKHTFKIVVPNLESNRITGGVSYRSDAYTYVAGTRIAPILPVLEDGWTLKASGLPAGLKLTGGKNGIPYSIEGTSTAKPGSYTVTLNLTKGKEKDVATITINIENRMLTLAMAVVEGVLTNGCKVTGGGSYAAGKKVTLKATAAAYKKATAKTPEQLATVFAGWYRDSSCMMPLEGAVDFRTTSYAYVTKDEDESIYAKFVPATMDMTIGLVINGENVVDDSGDVRVVVKDAATLPVIELMSVSIPKISAKGLPSGMKWDAKANRFTGAPTKPGIYKVSVSLTNTTVKKAIVRAFTVEVPNFVSPAFPELKPESDAYPLSVGVSSLPGVDARLASDYADYTVKVSGLPSGLSWKNGVLTGLAKKAGDYTVTFTATKGKSKQVATITIHVEALPEWAVGTFVGMVRQVDYDAQGNVVMDGDGRHDWYDGEMTVTVSAKGKISGKFKLPGSGGTGAFSASAFSSNGEDGCVATGSLKLGKEKLTVELQIMPRALTAGGSDLAGDVKVSCRGTESGTGYLLTFSTDESRPLRQQIWKSKTLPLPPNIDKKSVALEQDGLVYSLSFGKSGAVNDVLASADNPKKAIKKGKPVFSVVGYWDMTWHCELFGTPIVDTTEGGEERLRVNVNIASDGSLNCALAE